MEYLTELSWAPPSSPAEDQGSDPLELMERMNVLTEMLTERLTELTGSSSRHRPAPYQLNDDSLTDTVLNGQESLYHMIMVARWGPGAAYGRSAQ